MRRARMGIPIGPIGHVTAFHFFLYLWRLARPEFWLVTLLPFYIGYVVASHAFLPGLPLWSRLWETALNRGVTTAEFHQTWDLWYADARPLLLGALALGPLIWGATLVYNDYWDYHADRRNPRRSKSPLVRDLITLDATRLWAWLLGFAGLFVAFYVTWTFTFLLVLLLFLSWAYSAPPLRLKGRPGMDVAVNAIGIGFLCALAGWSLARPLTDFNLLFFVQGSLTFVGLYLPTTLVDHRWDRREGIQTFAVHFGPRRTFQVGFLAFALSNLGAIVFALNDFVIPTEFLPILVPFEAILLAEYYFLIGRYDREPILFAGIVLVALTLGTVNLLFALAYTGLWSL